MFFKIGKKLGKRSSKKAEETEDIVPKISSLTIKLDDMFATFELLQSDEEHRVLSALCEINEFINKYTKQGIDFLEGYDITARIIDNLGKSFSTRLMTMKIIIKLLSVDSTLITLKTSHNSFIALLNIFEQSNNTIEIEYSTNLLSKICRKRKYSEILSTDPIIDRLFNLVAQTPDPDVKGYCLKILYSIVRCVAKRDTVSESPYFNIIVLNLILQVQFKFLREIVVDILYIVSDYNSELMQNKLFKNNTILYLLDILLEKKWTITQNKAINVIYNCIKYCPIQTQCIETKKFLRMVAMPKNNPHIDLHHTLGILSLITKFAEVTENLQVMVDFKVYELLIEFCKFNCNKITMRFCDAVSEFAKNSQTIVHLANVTTLREIKKIWQNTKLKWIPYRQSGIKAIHSFVVSDPDLCIFFSECKMIKPLQDAILNKSEIDGKFYKMSLEIFQYMNQYTRLVSSLWNKNIYQQFVELLNETDDIFEIAINVLQTTLHNDNYRYWFVEFHGLDKISALLTNENQELDRANQVIKFLKSATKYKDISAAVVTAGMVQMILDCSQTYVTSNTICETIITDIYRVGLSVKFYITGCLNYTEKTKNGFCICINDLPESSRSTSEEEKDLTKEIDGHSVITINFHGGKETIPEGIRDSISSPVLKSPRMNDDIQEDSCEKQNTYVLNFDSPVPQTSGPINDDSMTYKLLVPPPPIDYDPLPDYYLRKSLKAAKNLMFICSNYTIQEKIQVLAKFVVSSLNGHDDDLPMEQQFQAHITELKQKLKTNHVPLGYLRMGTMRERALLFKVLADKVDITCTLQRGQGSIAWNEVCVGNVFDQSCTIPLHLQSNFYGKCIVDLMVNIGNLILKGTDCSKCYCTQKPMKTGRVKRMELITKYIYN